MKKLTVALALFLALSLASFSQANALTVHLSDQYIQGSYRYCVYRYNADEWVRKIPSHDYCDLTIEVDAP